MVMSSTQVNYSRTTTSTRRYDQYGNPIDDVRSRDYTTHIAFARQTQSDLQCFDTVGWAPGRASGL